MAAFSGLSADARVLIDHARRECESYKLTLEDPVKLKRISRIVADIKQVFKQTNYTIIHHLGIHTNNWPTSFRYFYAHWWLRPRWNSASLHD
jgi:20S proteasome alpha/beta subunit